DIGCGDKKLESILRDKNIDLKYFGFDLQPQSSDVSQFDVTNQLLPRRFDVAALLGVTEYISDLPRLMTNVAARCNYIVFSHVIADLGHYSSQDLERLGWISHKTEREIERTVTLAGCSTVSTRVTREGRTVLWL